MSPASPPFRAEITDKDSGSGRWLYAWSQVETGYATGDDQPPVAARSGTLELHPAVEINDQEVDVGTVVHLRERGYVDGQMWFEFQASGTAAQVPISAWKSPAVYVATTTALPSCTYANGSAGVGATLTGNANGALAAQDGVTLTAGRDILVKNEPSALRHGIYRVTQIGSAGAPFVLTRRDDCDTGPDFVSATVSVQIGTTQADTIWQCTANDTPAVGTDSLVWNKVGPLSVSEVDGAPSYGSINSLQVNQADGFVLTGPMTGVARISLTDATETQAGKVGTGAQTFGGDKTFAGNVVVGQGAGNTVGTFTLAFEGSGFFSGITAYARQSGDVGYVTPEIGWGIGPNENYGFKYRRPGSASDFGCFRVGRYLQLQTVNYTTGAIRSGIESTQLGPGAKVENGIVYANGLTPAGFGAQPDSLVLWDQADDTYAFVSLGTGLSYDHSTHTLSAAGAVASVNGHTGTVSLSAADVGADASGTATAAIAAHEAATDPHPQYLTGTEADALYEPLGGGGVTDGDKGDITVSGTGATWTIDSNVVTDAKLRQSAGLSVVGRSANSTGNVGDITAASDGQVVRRSGTSVGFGAVDLTNSAAVTGILPAANGGTANGFTTFTGPTTSTKTFTLPNASATILTSNAAVTVAQGGTGATSLTAYAVVCGGTTSTGALQSVASLGSAGEVLTSNGAGALPTFQTPSAAGSVPTGTIIDFGAATAPTGYLSCDGSAVSRATYSALFGVIGTTWGAGNGSTTFNVPDLRGRDTVGAGGSAYGSFGANVGDVGGTSGVSLSVSEMPAHSHTVPLNFRTATVSGNNTGAEHGDISAGFSGGIATSAAGTGAAHYNVQPGARTLKCIKT